VRSVVYEGERGIGWVGGEKGKVEWLKGCKLFECKVKFGMCKWVGDEDV